MYFTQIVGYIIISVSLNLDPLKKFGYFLKEFTEISYFIEKRRKFEG